MIQQSQMPRTFSEDDAPIRQERKRPGCFQFACEHLNGKLLELSVEDFVIEARDRLLSHHLAEVLNRPDEVRQRIDLLITQRVLESRHAVRWDPVRDDLRIVGFSMRMN